MDTMGRKIQIYQGLLSALPTLAIGEPGVAFDDTTGMPSLWVGTTSGNKRIQAEQYVIDDLVSNDPNASLSARQGKLLKEMIDASGGGSGVAVVDNLLSNSPVSALSARQGKILNEKIVNHENNKNNSKHIELATQAPVDLTNTGVVFLRRDESTATTPGQPTFDELEQKIGELETKVTKQLDDITKDKLYVSAMSDLSFNPKQLLFFYRAILKGSCKVAFWGDSITEGISCPSKSDTYYSRVCRQLKILFPSVSFTFENFAIAGTGISATMNETFVASNVTPQPQNTFWRSWAVEGKSWKQHIIEFNPDLVFFAFGMNDMGMGYRNSESFYTNLNLVKTMFTNSFESDLVIVNNMLPTLTEPSVYNIDYANGIAESMRVWCKDNDVPLVDVNRLSNILMRGKDIQATMLGDETVCRDLFISTDMQVNDLGLEKSNIIVYRNINDECFFLVLIYAIDATNFKADLYHYINDIPQTLGEYSFSSSLGFNVNVKVDCASDNHNIYINDNLAISIKTPIGLYDGAISFSNWGSGTTTNTHVEKLVPYSTNSILGQYALMGNNSNHPISLGHYLMYYNAFNALFSNVVNIKKAPASVKISDWQPASLDYTPPVNKKLYYQIVDMMYDQNNGVTLLCNNKIKTIKNTNTASTTSLISEDEFSMWNWNATQKIIFIAIPEADSPSECILNYYTI